jgi:hypothetical protein
MSRYNDVKLSPVEKIKSLSGITPSVLSPARHTVLCRCSTKTIFSICSRGEEEEEVHCSAQSSYNEGPIPPLLAEEFLLLSSNGRWGEQTHIDTQEGSRLHDSNERLKLI